MVCVASHESRRCQEWIRHGVRCITRKLEMPGIDSAWCALHRTKAGDARNGFGMVCVASRESWRCQELIRHGVRCIARKQEMPGMDSAWCALHHAKAGDARN